MTWSRKSLEPSSQSAILKITQKAQFVLDLFAVFQLVYLKKRSKMPLYKAWDVKRETRKAVGAGGGGGYIFQTRIGKGGIIFTTKHFWGVQF